MIQKDRSIFIFAGEVSADMHGGKLLQSLKNDFPTHHFFGVGGSELCASGLDALYTLDDFNIMGFTDVLRALPRLIKQFYFLRNQIIKKNPEMVIFIDSPALSLRMAKSLRKKGYKGKIIQYICPTVWAYHPKRITKLEMYFDLLLTIFPFEEAYFKQTSLRTKYVGNPIKERIKSHLYKNTIIDEMAKKGSLISLFPGSRKGEIQRNLPKQLESLKNIGQDNQIQFAISCGQSHLKPMIEEEIKKAGLAPSSFYFVPKELTYELMKQSHIAIAKSGTVTLELALHDCPTIVVYQLSTLNFLFAKYILKLRLPFYCIANILAGEKVFSELMGPDFTSEHLLQEILRMHLNAQARIECTAKCKHIHDLLGDKNSSQEAARAISELKCK
jgi:lipid-A-disaccharide synthase